MENQYGITKATPSLPAIDLLRVPHKGKTLLVGYPAFGPHTHRNNLETMSKEYSHSKELPKISFKPATTSESISVVTYDFEKIKKEIFDPRWLQAGYIVRTQDGVFANTSETKESVLKSMLDKCEKVNGIYLGENDFGFAPYKTFETGVQDCDTFSQGGLARVLEHTKEKTAENLRTIASPKFYKRGVNVWGFDKVKEPILRVAYLGSDGDFDYDRLDVGGFDWNVYYDGYAFGVLRE
ncbi:MAG: hypothetical protein Q8P15_00620 [Nanoarchaeota archaeon]|nr:hypothetical protein [Nanoarchaeota archaeon]